MPALCHPLAPGGGYRAREGGPITIVCLDRCSPEKVASAAESLEEFFVDGQDTPLLPLRHCPVEGWVVRLPLDEYAELLEAAA